MKHFVKITGLKIVAILFLLLIVQCIKAQISAPTQMAGKRGYAGDTVTNTGSAADSLLLFNNYASGSVLATLTKVSGTASDTLYLQGSVDGQHWVLFGQDTVKTGTFTGTYTYTWQLPGKASSSGLHPTANSIPAFYPYLYIRVLAKGVGTQVAILKSYDVAR